MTFVYYADIICFPNLLMTATDWCSSTITFSAYDAHRLCGFQICQIWTPLANTLEVSLKAYSLQPQTA